MSLGWHLPEFSRPLFFPLLSLLGIVILATAVMLLVRIYIVEPEPVALACAALNSGWRCAVREVAVYGFLHNVFAIAAFGAGCFATIARWRWLAAVAMLAGIAGAVLYTFELSGVGLLLGALVWVRSSIGTSANITDKHHASG